MIPPYPALEQCRIQQVFPVPDSLHSLKQQTLLPPTLSRWQCRHQGTPAVAQGLQLSWTPLSHPCSGRGFHSSGTPYQGGDLTLASFPHSVSYMVVMGLQPSGIPPSHPRGGHGLQPTGTPSWGTWHQRHSPIWPLMHQPRSRGPQGS